MALPMRDRAEAATHLVGKRTNGWGFFLTDQSTKTTLRAARLEYLHASSGELEEDETDEEGDEDEDGEEAH